MAITDWPAEQRPRERLIRHGAGKLSDAELLALVLRVGVTGKSAVDLGHEMLTHFGSLKALFHAPLAQFACLHGLGPAKYALFQAVFELARRALAEQLKLGIHLASPQNVKAYLQLMIAQSPHEIFSVLYLDVQHRLLDSEALFRGSLTQTSVYPREVVKAALARNAAAVIFAHNHPSGCATPSTADRELTVILQRTLALVDVKVLDHFVVTQNEVYSFAEHGLL